MLQAIRRGTGSWITKGFLLIIVLSFAVWGVGDILRGPRDRAVLSVGDTEITTSRFANEYQRGLRVLQARVGSPIGPEDAARLGVVDMTIRRLVDGTLVDQAAAGLGLAVSDDLIKRQVFANPAFQNADGAFDQLIFERWLQPQGLSPQTYFAVRRQDITRAQLVGSIAGGEAVPAILAEAMERYRGERRVAEIMTVPDASFADVGTASEAEIEDFHRNRASRYMAPAYRGVTYISLIPGDLMDEVSVSEDELREEYDRRLDDYVTPPRRRVGQMVFDDRAAAEAAHDRLSTGQSFETVAAEALNLTVDDVDLGVVTEDDLPFEVSPAVFALAENAVSEPLQSPFGWHLFRVSDVEPGGQRTFDEVREELAFAMKLDRAIDALFDLSTRIDDTLAGGATLEETATRLSLPLSKIEAIDARGDDPSGAALAERLSSPQFLSLVFQSEVGLESQLTETDEGGYFILRVDRTIDPALRPLESVRETVIADWTAERRAKAALDKADELVERIRGGADMKALGKEFGYVVRDTARFKRAGFEDEPLLSGGLRTGLFDLAVGEATRGGTALRDGQIVARLTEIVPLDPSRDPADLDRIQEELTAGMADDLLTQYRAALEQAFAVSIDRPTIDSLVGISPGS